MFRRSHCETSFARCGYVGLACRERDRLQREGKELDQRVAMLEREHKQVGRQNIPVLAGLH